MAPLFRLTLEGMDEESTELLFDSKEEAISHARTWFLGGYTEGEPEWPEILSDADELKEQLSSTGNFYCGRGYERVILAPLP